MIKEIHISGFRGIREGVVSGLTPITVFVGPNNCGKSTVLEALYIGGHQTPEVAVSDVGRRREMNDGYKWLFTVGANSTSECRIEVNGPNGTVREVQVGPGVEPTQLFRAAAEIRPWNAIIPFNPSKKHRKLSLEDMARDVLGNQTQIEWLKMVPEVRLVDPSRDQARISMLDLYSQYSQAGLRGGKNEVIKIVQDIFPEIEDVQILMNQNQPTLHTFIHGGAHPVQLCGDGVQLLMRMCFELAISRGGVVLIEEPETRLHPAAIQQVARAIWAAMARGIQVVMSTHSLDLIDSLLAVAPKGVLDSLSVKRFGLKDGKLSCVDMPGKDVVVFRGELEKDLR